jgi:hypothetical protein
MQTAENGATGCGDQAAHLRCLCCRTVDPEPEMTCHQGRDHRVGQAAGCPACGRLVEACAARPCSAMRLVVAAGSRAG